VTSYRSRSRQTIRASPIVQQQPHPNSTRLTEEKKQRRKEEGEKEGGERRRERNNAVLNAPKRLPTPATLDRHESFLSLSVSGEGKKKEKGKKEGRGEKGKKGKKKTNVERA